MTEEVRKKIGATADRLYPINFRDTANNAVNRAKAAQKDSYINGAYFGYSLAEEELAEKDRVIAELKLALNEADKKIKQLDTKPY